MTTMPLEALNPWRYTMNFYQVTIQATITKTFSIEAASEDDAAMEATEMFTTGPDAIERYEQDVISIKAE